MKYFYTLLTVFICLLLYGCSDDYLYQSETDDEISEGALVETRLSLFVKDFSVASSVTRDAEPSDNPEEELESESHIDNVWVFQYKDDDEGKLLIKPMYIKISENQPVNNLKVLLKEKIPSKICVVANTNSETWGNDAECSTFSRLQEKSIPNPSAKYTSDLIRNPIPMGGSKQVTVSSDLDQSIEIEVKRMYAKLKIYFGSLVEGMSPKLITVSRIPFFCRVGTIANLDERASDYNISRWDTRDFLEDDYDKSDSSSSSQSTESGNTNADGSSDQNSNTPESKYYVLYVPENIQGESDNIIAENKGDNHPENALVINLNMNYTDQSGVERTIYYSIYPGGNNYNNFNIRRNCVYRVKINITKPGNEIHTPSANCFVRKTGKLFYFEPYYRPEKGGGYSIADYLTPNDPNDTDERKVIKYAKIIWQTKDAIGDNTPSQLEATRNEEDYTQGNLVRFELNETDPYYSRIYVRTWKEGNALIGAFNKYDEIIWSWHIWITDNEPDVNPITYTTYDWDNNKIYSCQQGITDGTVYDRVPGYAIMPCNLGALDIKPKSNNFNDVKRTFGMFYQWGRKDPFPPNLTQAMQGRYYNDDITGIHYSNDNITPVSKFTDISEMTNAEANKTIAFYSKFAREIDNSIQYSVNHPLVFICATKKFYGNITDGESYSNTPSSYDNNNGDWMKVSDNKLWGGLEPVLDRTAMKYFTINNTTHMFDNYGSEKSIFDPCPSGWRVPPGDLWLGLSKNGKNPGSWDNYNYDKTSTDKTNYGNYLFMTESRWDNKGNIRPDSECGPSLFFPTQGSRVADGSAYRCGTCGNYHNATADISNRINAFHVHNRQASPNMIFDTGYDYTRKALAAAVRCVRDTKIK